MKEAWRQRQLLLISSTVRLKRGKFRPRLSTASMSGKRERGRTLRNTRNAFAGDTKSAAPEAGSRGRAGVWTGHTVDSAQRDRIVKKGEQKQRGEINGNEYREGVDSPIEGMEAPCVSQSPSVVIQENNHAEPPHRKRVSTNSMSRREAFEKLKVEVSRSSHEVRQKHRMLERKYHPDECRERCRLAKKEGEDMLKNLSSACSMISGDSRR